MPSHPTYEGPCRVRVLPPGVSGHDQIEGTGEMRALAMPKWGVPPEGYETTLQAGMRFGSPRSSIRAWVQRGKLAGIIRGTGKRRRIFVKKGAKPT